MEILLIFIFFMLGCVMGSFLNVVIERTKRRENFFLKRSHCDRCKKELGFWDLIPLFSFIFLKGKCRYCGKKIAAQHFWVELATGFVFALVYISVGTLHATSLQINIINIYQLIFNIIIASFLIIIFIYDLKYYLILDKFSLPAMAVVLGGNLLLGRELGDLCLGALIGGGLFLFQYVISRGKWVGGGDIRLGLLMGLVLGWKLVLVALFIAYLTGAIFGLILIAGKKKKMKDPMPFGTFLSASTLVALLYGKIILDWYLNWF